MIYLKKRSWFSIDFTKKSIVTNKNMFFSKRFKFYLKRVSLRIIIGARINILISDETFYIRIWIVWNNDFFLLFHVECNRNKKIYWPKFWRWSKEHFVFQMKFHISSAIEIIDSKKTFFYKNKNFWGLQKSVITFVKYKFVYL